MRSVRRIVRFVVRFVVLVALALVLPYVVPFTSTGTLTHREAADATLGAGAEFVDVLGIELHVERWSPSGAAAAASGATADRPLIVLLHGFGASTLTWRDTAPALAELGEVVAYDRPAFGFTERILDDERDAFVAREGVDPYGPDGQVVLLDALLDALLDVLLASGAGGADGADSTEGRPVILVGHSAGGTLAAEYALTRPERVAGVVLVAPAILTTGGTPAWVRPALALPPLERGGPFVARLAARGSGTLLERSWHDPSRIDDAMRARYAAPEQVRDWERGLWALVAASGSYTVGTRAAEIRVPTLLVTGDDDRIVPTADTRTLAELVAGAELVVLDGVGHIPQEEDAGGTVDAVRTFVTTLAR
jgi:pimeloyl-ACP methyl ester carboxylesterase